MLRTAIHELERFPEHRTVNVSSVADYVHVERPVSVAALLERLDGLPDAIPFSTPIVTDTALGGAVTLTLNRDGTHRFAGRMRATGVLSFSYRVSAVVRGRNNQAWAAAQHSGDVFGSDTPGERADEWDEPGSDPRRMQVVRNLWPDLSGSTLEITHSYASTGVLGVGLDALEDLAKFVAVAPVVGAPLAGTLVIGSRLHEAGSVPGLGGVVGLAVVGGSVLVFGPATVVPATVAGVAAGQVVDSMVQLRPLRTDEIAFAHHVFGDSLDYGRIRLTNLSGLKARAFVAPAIDGTILVNIGNALDQPLTAIYPAYPKPGQLLIHELTHAWQIHHAELDDGFVPGLYCDGILDQAFDPDPYTYGSASQAWSSHGMEAQASIVDQWFAGNGQQGGQQSLWEPMDLDNPYFGYVNRVVRARIP